MYSQGGQAFVVLRSLTRDGRGRITGQLSAGSVVTTMKNTVDHVVTEWGVAELRGRTLEQRTQALIRVAHPSTRDDLRSQARRLGLLERRFLPVVDHRKSPLGNAWEEVVKLALQDDTDAILHVDAATICGTNLHILKGDVPAVAAGRILGHEAVGTVESGGSGVKNVKPGDKYSFRVSPRVEPAVTAAKPGTGNAWVGAAGFSDTSSMVPRPSMSEFPSRIPRPT
jgi:hypothetical protein